jgi:hypothetical protein
MTLPFILLRSGPDVLPLFAGLDQGTLVGLTVPGGDTFPFELADVLGAVSADPAAVYWGLALQWAEVAHRQAAEAVQRWPAAEAARRAPAYAARGHLFDPVLDMTGFPEDTLLRHRTSVPSLDTIRLSGLFAVSTVRTSIEQAEKSFNCFVALYEERGRALPDIEDIRRCFRGLQNSKSRMFHEVAAYAPVIREGILRGLQDRELRRWLVRETDLPVGLGVTKMSFTLALLGHDCVCLDARLLGRMFGSREKATEVESGWGKTGAHVSELSLRRYEKVEEAFLRGNPFYRTDDPIGRARAQWMSWESVGGQAAKHSVWLRVVS